jgi:hypothetical protein
LHLSLMNLSVQPVLEGDQLDRDEACTGDSVPLVLHTRVSISFYHIHSASL